MLTLALAACAYPATPLPSITATAIPPSPSFTFTHLPASTSLPTQTITPSPSATSTETPLPSPTPTLAPLDIFNTRLLRTGVIPQTYLANNCTYLARRWSAGGSLPGTVVLPIMFHSIAEDGTVLADPSRDITVSQFTAFVAYARSLGFETISTAQLLGFLSENQAIPARSMMIIVDDRRPGLIRDRIMPVLEENNWVMTAAYIANPDSLLWAWDLMDQLAATGRMDVQSHGYSGQLYVLPETPADKIRSEIWDSTPVLEKHFGVRPIAFIWPGGNFTSLSVEIARQGGYLLGFSAYSRGPLMFDWVPLGAEEQAVNDPLMVLPRAWSSAANVNLDEAVRMGAQAADFAAQNFTREAEWYHTYCGAELTNPFK